MHLVPRYAPLWLCQVSHEVVYIMPLLMSCSCIVISLRGCVSLAVLASGGLVGGLWLFEYAQEDFVG